MCASTNINSVLFFFSKGEKKTLKEMWLPNPILKYVKVGGVVYKTLEKDAYIYTHLIRVSITNYQNTLLEYATFDSILFLPKTKYSFIYL